MAYQKLKVEHNLPVVAATDVCPRTFLTPGGTSTLLGIPITTNSQRPYWHSENGTIASGAAIPAQEPGQILKAVAAASLGAGAEVGVASSNSALSAAALVAASGHWAVGVALSPAAAGEVFSVDFRPRKV